MFTSRTFLGIALSFVCLIFSQSVFAKDSLSLPYLIQNWPQPLNNQPFNETRYDTLLGLTSEYKGAFKFNNKSDISIVYTSPIKGSIELRGQSVTVNFPSKTVSVSLEQVPEVKSFIEPVKALLSGDVEKLIKENKVMFSSENVALDKSSQVNQSWTLTLSPPGSIVLSAKEVTVKGGELKGKVMISSIKLTFANGDWREFRLDGVENDR
ncbi:hypothetical protein [Hydrogenovibrio kuenenii]|uniref:hypothetical protein n=1 Tax=Hydrogenovibrio kuenenii TaxID=63658 RepID=UPI0004634137|nr:hypothetical protein [Hydrogenovibrio kuenenii]